MASPVRPSRRAATKARVIDSSDEENSLPSVADTSRESEEYTPAPKQPVRRTMARRSLAPNGDATATPRTTTRGRKPKATVTEEVSEIASPADTDMTEATVMTTEPSSPVKKSPPKRRTIRQSRGGGRVGRPPRMSSAIPDLPPPQLPTPTASASPEPTQAEDTIMKDAPEPEPSQLPTPQPSASPEPTSLPSLPKPRLRPLSEVSNSTLNASPALEPTEASLKPLDPRPAPLEKPMDIVLRTRATTHPSLHAPTPTGPRSRIVITYLHLTNFKSYAGRQSVGPFHTSFSSVVGPNGSGKSNVIDSLLFVFGFRASKMRQGKLSALIHNSAGFPDLEYCEVQVEFQEVVDLVGGGVEVVEGSELVVSRKAFRNNSSSYYINGKSSNFTVVTTLLKEKGVDLDHKRFLILQGEVESIAQMKPKAGNEHEDGLLEYLEDIIGTSKYKTPIEESAAETETLNEVCLEKNSRVQHVEKEKNSLEEKKNKALAYIWDENELATKQSGLYQIYIDECNDNLEVTAEAIANMQAQLDEELRKHQGGEEVIKGLEKQYKTGSKEYEKLEQQTQAVLKEMAKLDKETVKLEEKKKFLTGKAKKLEKSMESSRFAAAEAKTQAKQCGDDIERNAVQIAELEEKMQAEEKELASIRESLKGKTQGLSDQIAAKQKELEPWNQKINDKQSEMALAQSELDILQEKDNAGAVAIAEVEAKIAGLQEKKQAKRQEIEQCKEQQAALEEQAQGLEAEVEKLATKEPAIRSKLSGARQKADEARASLSATQTQGNVLNGLMRLKESGRINGFHGRLGNLGVIDQKYDVAISTACPSLDNLVVDSVEVGQQCIEYLRKNNLGRANFICLDRLPNRDLSAIDTPENVPRLYDLVKSKHDRFLPAFYSVLQNTLVASDLQSANRIAYGAKRWRVVTLDGQLIDKSGTMSGGGTRVARGGMSSKLVAETSKDQVAKLERDRDELEQTFQEFQQQQRELDGQLRSLRDQIPQLETKIQKLTLEVGSLERNIADAEKHMRELSAAQQPSKTDKGRMAALEKTIAGLEKEIAKLHNETAGLEEEIKALQDRIMEVGGVKLRGQKAKVDGLKGQIDTLTEETSTAEVNKAKAEKQLIQHEKAQADAAAELELIAVDMEKAEEAMKKHISNTTGSRQQAEEAQMALEERKDELAALKKELDEKQAELNSTRGIEIEMRNKLEENQKVLADYQKRHRYWTEKLSKLTFQNVADLEGPPKQPAETEDSQAEKKPQDAQEGNLLPTYTKDELADMSKDLLKAEIAALEEKTQSTPVDLSVLSEYRRRVDEHALRSQDLASAILARDTAKKRCDELRRLRLEGFMEGFSTISLRLKEMYQMITMGGNAELELVDSLDPFSEGILFSVMPPKKSWKNISNLSGGEKTLSSLALVFALHHYKPTPLYVMDEIDAALDFRNVSIVASYIKERTKNAQFIVISLRNNMFELASRLVGVYKVNHMTKSVTVENKDYITRN